MRHLRFLALAGSLLVGSALHGQQDSLSFRAVGTRVDSIVPDASDRAAATLGELLKGRAAGLNVAESSGSLGAAPRLWLRGVSSLVLHTRPLIVVDGVPALAWTDTLGGSQVVSTSAPDMLSASDIASVRVLRGPAATAAYGPEGAAGVLEIRTRAGEAAARGGALRVEAWSALSARDDVGRYPLRYRRPGRTVGGAVVETCTAELELRGACTPPSDVVTVTDPMAEADAFRTGLGYAAGARVGGGALDGRLGFGVQVSAEDADGAHTQNSRRQRAVAGAGRLTLPRGARLEAHGGVAVRDLTLPLEGNTILAAAARVLLYEDDLPSSYAYDQGEDSEWTRIGASLDWPVASWLSVGGRWGRDRVASEALQEYSGTSTFTMEGDATRSREAWEALASLRGAAAGASGVLSAGAGRVDEAYRRTTEIRQQGGLVEGQNRERTFETEHAFARAGVAYRRLSLAATGRRDRLRGGDPGGERDAYSVGAEWALPGTGRLDGLRLRGAHGSAERGTERVADPAGLACIVGCADLEPEVLTETEVGVDVAAFGRLEVGATAYRRRTDDLFAVGSAFGGLPAVRNVGASHDRGIEASAAVEGTAGRAAWRLEARQAWNRNRLELTSPSVMTVSYFGHHDGYPAGSLFGYRLNWRDLDGNGVLIGSCTAPQACEVQRSRDAEYLGTSIPRQVGAAGGTLRYGALRMDALADWQGGVQRHAGALSLYCGYYNCEESYVRDERLAEQARLQAPLNEGWVFDAGFVRLREVSLTLSAPARRLRGIARGVDLTLAGRNLAVWTSYPGFDPETASTAQSAFAWRELFEQPPLRTVTTRVDVRF